jgi:2-amino-4-hydroxy-6-hydroxymethyldihydropteridine diphosphokinase
VLRRWLLSLSSNLDTDARLQSTLIALASLGPAARVTPILREPAYNDPAASHYFHALMTLDTDSLRTDLIAALKRIERNLGRIHGVPSVAIDIDILACDDGGGWMADPHAAAKREFDHVFTRQLMTAAGIVVADAPRNGTQLGTP